jgi:hypothetical protein
MVSFSCASTVAFDSSIASVRFHCLGRYDANNSTNGIGTERIFRMKLRRPLTICMLNEYIDVDLGLF